MGNKLRSHGWKSGSGKYVGAICCLLSSSENLRCAARAGDEATSHQITGWPAIITLCPDPHPNTEYILVWAALEPKRISHCLSHCKNLYGLILPATNILPHQHRADLQHFFLHTQLRSAHTECRQIQPESLVFGFKLTLALNETLMCNWNVAAAIYCFPQMIKKHCFIEEMHTQTHTVTEIGQLYFKWVIQNNKLLKKTWLYSCIY